MRTIAKYSGSTIVGLNNNEYQLKRLAIHNDRNKLSHLCSGVKGNFLDMPFPDASFDSAFAFEATCHAPNRVDVYRYDDRVSYYYYPPTYVRTYHVCPSEIFRTLKPGGKYAMYEWCLTDKYDANSKLHQEIRHGVEIGDGLPPLYTTHETIKAMKEAV